ncbi:MAG: hypothetical protein SOZ58_08165 [Prevotella sp.]|nr:hypothetical protein [Prevotella sp.]
MKRSELSKIYEDRIAKARDMIAIADESLQRAKVDMSLQYYYWAYSLIRSLMLMTTKACVLSRCSHYRYPQ